MAIGIASAVGAPHVETFGRRLFVRRFAPQFRELPLLFRRQFVFDSHEQRYLLSLDFPFRRQHLFQLRQYLLLVHARLLGQPHQFFHFILQLPLQFREFQLRLADFRLEVFFLLRAQANCFLMLNHQFRSKKTLPNRVLIRLLRVDCAARKKKCCANAENSCPHFIPPHPSSPEHSNTIGRVSASPSKSLARESSTGRRWELAILPVSARRLLPLPESLVHFFAAMSRQQPTASQPRRLPLPMSTLSTACRASLLLWPRPQQAPAPGNPPRAPLLAPPAAAAHPAAPRALEPRQAQRSNSHSFADALLDPSP